VTDAMHASHSSVSLLQRAKDGHHFDNAREALGAPKEGGEGEEEQGNVEVELAGKDDQESNP